MIMVLPNRLLTGWIAPAIYNVKHLELWEQPLDIRSPGCFCKGAPGVVYMFFWRKIK